MKEEGVTYREREGERGREEGEKRGKMRRT